jgi:hypothetical protein
MLNVLIGLIKDAKMFTKYYEEFSATAPLPMPVIDDLAKEAFVNGKSAFIRLKKHFCTLQFLLDLFL